MTKRWPVHAKGLGLSVAGLLVITACGSGGGSATPSSSGSSIDYSTLQKKLTAFKAVPTFTAPGPAVNAAKAHGDSIFSLPTNSSIPVYQAFNPTMQQLAQQFGMSFTTYSNGGQVSQWVSGMDAAIAQHSSIISLDGSPNPQVLQPAISRAHAAGIPVVDSHNFGQEDDNPASLAKYNLVAMTPAPFAQAAEAMVDYTVVRSHGSVDALLVGPFDITPTAPFVAHIQQDFGTACGGGCKTTVLNTPTTQGSSDIEQAIQTALLRDPGINYVIPVYDYEALYAAPAITQAGAAARVKVVTYNGTPAVLDAMRTGNIIVADVGESWVWIAYAQFDQELRVLTGIAPLLNEFTPIRLFTSDNVAEAGVPAQQTDNFPTPTDYLKLWGAG